MDGRGGAFQQADLHIACYLSSTLDQKEGEAVAVTQRAGNLTIFFLCTDLLPTICFKDRCLQTRTSSGIMSTIVTTSNTYQCLPSIEDDFKNVLSGMKYM